MLQALQHSDEENVLVLLVANDASNRIDGSVTHREWSSCEQLELLVVSKVDREGATLLHR